MDGHWGHYAKWNKSEKNTVWSHLYVESKQNKINKQKKTQILYTATESSHVTTKDSSCCNKETKIEDPEGHN